MSDPQDSVADITSQVEARRQQEADELAAAEVEKPKKDTTGGPDDPRFVLQCLDNNERGDGVLAAAIFRGKFVYVKSRDEKSKAWFRYNGVHWEVDKADAHMIIPEGAALAYQQVAESLKPEIAEARDTLTSCNARVTAANQLAKDLKKDGSPEEITACHAEGRAAEVEANKTKAELSKLTHLHKDLTARCSKLRGLRGAKSCLEFSHKIGENGLYIYGDEVDQKPDLLPCKNGVIDLETGAIRKGNWEDFLVRAIPVKYVPGTPYKNWGKFISEIHENHQEKIAFIKRWWGYCLTGHVKEQVYTMFTGGGANGKGTMLEILQELFGELAKQIMAEMLVKTRNARSSTGASPDILSMQGRRWIFVDETNDGDQVNGAELKKTTGANRRSGRGLFDKFDTDFRPTHKLSIVSNHTLRGIAETFSLKRRLVYLEYPLRYVENVPAHQAKDPGNASFYRPIDKDLDNKLRQELEGILCYLVEGAGEWYQQGLAVPQCLKDAADEVEAKEDTLGQFIQARARIHEDYSMVAKDFLQDYLKWYLEEGHPDRWKPTRNKTYDQLRAKGFNIPSNSTTGGTTKVFGLDIPCAF